MQSKILGQDADVVLKTAGQDSVLGLSIIALTAGINLLAGNNLVVGGILCVVGVVLLFVRSYLKIT